MNTYTKLQPKTNWTPLVLAIPMREYSGELTLVAAAGTDNMEHTSLLLGNFVR